MTEDDDFVILIGNIIISNLFAATDCQVNVQTYPIWSQQSKMNLIRLHLLLVKNYTLQEIYMKCYHP